MAINSYEGGFYPFLFALKIIAILLQKKYLVKSVIIQIIVLYLYNKSKNMTQEQMTQVVINRATEMLKDAKINSIYQSFKTENEAKDWIMYSALATLIIPVSKRKAANK